MNKWTRSLLVILTCWTTFSACEEKKPQEASKNAFVKAMKLLEKGEMDKYYQCLDFGQELDSLTQAQIAKMWTMHQLIKQKDKGKIIATEVTKVELTTDTLATVYYKVKYGSGNEEVSANKMVCKNGEWKIRVRN